MPNRIDSKAFAIWFTGLSGAGKSTICNAVALRLREQDMPVQILDGDHVRKDLCSDLGLTFQDQIEDIRRLAYIADLLVRNGIIALIAAVSPLRIMRETARTRIGAMLEVFVDAPLEVCKARDPNGSYETARSGVITDFTGITAPYEVPLAPDIVCRTHLESILESTEKVFATLDALTKTLTTFEGTYGSREQSEHRTIAVDLDGVIADYSGWKGRDVIGSPRQDVVGALKELRAEGWKIVVHTTRCDQDIVEYLLKYEIPFDEINRNSETLTLGIKPHANIYWDDRALRYSGNAQEDLKLIRMFRTWNGRP